jgi:transcription elongation factor Elf1
METISCLECGQDYYVSSLWLVDNDNKTLIYCHKCKKETEHKIPQLSHLSRLILEYARMRKSSKRGRECQA